MNYSTYTSELYKQPPLQTSAAQAWSGVRVERYQLAPGVMPAHFHGQHLLLIHQAAQAVRTHRPQGNRVEEAVFQCDDAGLYPAGEYGPSAWDEPADIINVHLDPEWLETLARQSLDLEQFRLRERFQFEDALLPHVGRQLLAAAGREHALGQLYAESLVNTLGYHLIEFHASYERRIVGAGSRLSAAVLARIDSYVEAAAEQTVSLAALADLANLSVFHFARRFKLTTGRSPYQYVLDWKIKRARQLLQAGSLPIAAIGDALGFASPAHFSAAFKRVVGQSPREFQRG
ncbi:helix-turn-helix transcriptional regulator [Hymenobacter wooponensis]|uniref:AraC family transcriptional regulator n=1 Tax=Hymenobacter wooponensis TaxID=1525360 RepID=A0A4Z0ML14_9BACT|nr:helix-turn-helix transcriptional regulator [Hymenobacter wooponensis]TGD80453.1 AraC family transcriptional regulator [Hymenobacter wooponensis]